MNYYPFHIGDFRGGTSNMSRHARWVYRDMLDVYYDTEAPLPLDFEVLCDALGVEADDERRLVERLLRFKFLKTEFGYQHKICETVIADYHKKADIAVNNGKRGGRPPKAKTEETKSKKNPAKPSGLLLGSDPVNAGLANETQRLEKITQVKANETGSQANQEPRTKNQEKNNPVTPPTLSEVSIRGKAAQDLSDTMRKYGVNANPTDKRLQQLAEQGVSIEIVDAACIDARKSLPHQDVIPPGYVIKIIARWAEEAAALKVAGAVLPARSAPAHESARDRERRETIEGLTGSGHQSITGGSDDNPMA